MKPFIKFINSNKKGIYLTGRGEGWSVNISFDDNSITIFDDNLTVNDKDHFKNYYDIITVLKKKDIESNIADFRMIIFKEIEFQELVEMHKRYLERYMVNKI